MGSKASNKKSLKSPPWVLWLRIFVASVRERMPACVILPVSPFVCSVYHETLNPAVQYQQLGVACLDFSSLVRVWLVTLESFGEE